MLYAIFGDIHANLEAFEAVLADIEKQGVEKYVCMGDVVGYNADPSICLEMVRSMNCPVIKGNHDEDCTQEETRGTTNPIAREAQRWTYNKLSEEQRQWLQSLRFVRQVDSFTVVHSSLDQPKQWHYVVNKFDAMASMAYQFTQVCFIGHSHVPEIYARDKTVQKLEETHVTIEESKKYLINVGAVGQPRDGDWRASYCLYDTEAKTATLRRVEYDIETTQKKILAAGLPESLASRLVEGL